MERTEQNEILASLQEAIHSRKAISPLSSRYPHFTLNDAYEVQRMGLEAGLKSGQRLCGYKMGLTSRAKQRDVNVFEPIRGYLLSSMEVMKGEPVETGTRIHPRTEPEIAVIMGQSLRGDSVTLREVAQAIAMIVPALEIIDSRYESFSFKLPDVVADNTSASGFMLGTGNLIGSDLALLGITVRKNGVVVETGAPAAVLGDPLLSVVGLVRGLAKEGKGLEPGMVVLTGGITAAVPFQARDVIEMTWPEETIGFRAS